MRSGTCFNGAAVVRPRKRRRDADLASMPASMGPRSFDRGNAVNRSAACRQLPLQWGRGRSTAETHGRVLTTTWHARASMGPRSFDRGNVGKDSTDAPRLPASMGPRSFDRGNRPSRCVGDCRPDCQLQWGRGRATAETHGHACSRHSHAGASMGPRSFDRGNAADDSGPSTLDPARSFNGAALVRPRKQAFGSREGARDSSASMGPRSFDRGNGW